MKVNSGKMKEKEEKAERKQPTIIYNSKNNQMCFF